VLAPQSLKSKQHSKQTEEQSYMTKTNLRNALKQGEVTVTFTKADGSQRKMRATTNERMFNYTPRGADMPEPRGVVRVWDLDKNDWRSIREDRVINFA
jgi:hypothetical protein